MHFAKRILCFLCLWFLVLARDSVQVTFQSALLDIRWSMITPNKLIANLSIQNIQWSNDTPKIHCMMWISFRKYILVSTRRSLVKTRCFVIFDAIFWLLNFALFPHWNVCQTFANGNKFFTPYTEHTECSVIETEYITNFQKIAFSSRVSHVREKIEFFFYFDCKAKKQKFKIMCNKWEPKKRERS